MKTTFLISLTFYFFTLNINAQEPIVQQEGRDTTRLVNLDLNTTLSLSLAALREHTTEYNITFVHNDLDHLQVRLRAKDLTIPEAVERVCKGQPVKVKAKGKDIFVKYRPEKDRTIALWGHVRDSFTKHGILGAKITLLNEDSVVIDTMRTWRPNNDRDDAVYRFEVPVTHRTYTVIAEHPDYEPATIEYALKYVARNDFFDLPHHFMQRKVLQLDGGNLGEVVVKATKVQMVYRGDTLVYNADAFNVPEGSMLDALIKQMPGVEMNANGEIYVHGRKVDFLTLNGEDFFKGKNKVMLENLPYYTVKHIEVYEKQTDKSEWLGVADAPKDYVMDVVLKREYSIGYLANLQGAAGTEGCYMGRAFGLRYTDHSRLSAYVNANNTNEMRDPGNNGEWDPAKSMREGVINMKKAGISLNINDKDKRWTEDGNVEVAWIRQHKEEHTSTEHFLQTGNQFSRTINDMRYKDFQFGANNTFTLRKPFWFRNRVEASYGHNTGNGYERLARFTGDPSRIGFTAQVLDSAFHYSKQLMDMLVNMRNDDTRNSETEWRVEYKPNISYKFLWGDDIDLWGNLSYDDNRREDANRMVTEGLTTDNRHTHSWKKNRRTDWEAGIQYTVHSHSHWNYRAYVGYRHTHQHATNDHFRLDLLTDTLALNGVPTVYDSLLIALDANNSYDITANRRRAAPGAMVYYQHDNMKNGRRVWFSLSLPVQIDRIHTHYRTPSTVAPSPFATDTAFTWRKVTPTPSARFETTFNNQQNFLYVNYETAYIVPDMSRIVNIHIDQDPLNVQIGNGQLKRQFNHRLVVNYKVGRNKINQYLRFDGGLNIYQDALRNGQTFDPQTGVTYHRFENVKGNWDTWGQFSFGRMLDKQKRLWIETRTGLGYTHYVNVARSITIGNAEQDGRAVTNNWNITQRALLRYKWEKLTISPQVNYSTAWSKYRTPSAGLLTSLHITAVQYGLSGQYEFPILQGSYGRGLQVATDIMLYTKRGYSDKSLNTDDLVWNASIAKSLWKNKLVVKLEGFDILGQLTNIYSNINALGQVETWRNAVPSYLMLHVQWHFSHIPKKIRH
ncbi:MAG: TonB-dependent receptor [Prevotella sp.]|nr:TonB-dependent receptor [Prevotella sp.]